MIRMTPPEVAALCGASALVGALVVMAAIAVLALVERRRLAAKRTSRPVAVEHVEHNVHRISRAAQSRAAASVDYQRSRCRLWPL